MNYPHQIANETMPTGGNRVMIVEDDPNFLENFSDMLQKAGDINLVATAHDLASGLDLLNGPAPDALLVDLGLPDGSGLTLIKKARKHWGRDCRILVITVLADSNSVIMAIRHGADGYILKRHLPRDFIKDIRDLLAGRSPICSQIASDILKWFHNQPIPPKTDTISHLTDNSPYPLTPRERDVLQLLANGFTQKETAAKLLVSPQTIKEYVKRITQKMYEEFDAENSVENQSKQPTRKTITRAISLGFIWRIIK